jgi:hypothetical protein
MVARQNIVTHPPFSSAGMQAKLRSIPPRKDPLSERERLEREVRVYLTN